MNTYTIKRPIPVLTDGYILAAIVNMIGNAVVFFILRQTGILAWFACGFLGMLFVAPSIALAAVRYRLIISLNSTREKMIGTTRKMLQTESLIGTTNRNLYKRRMELLIKQMDKLAYIFEQIELAVGAAKDIKYQTVSTIHHLLDLADSREKTKLFLDKKND